MPKLHVYGDSYVEPPRQEYLELVKKGEAHAPWYAQVATALNVDEMHMHGKAGVSNEFIYDRWKQNLDRVNEGDYVIVVTTSPYRKWFFEHLPEFANIGMRGLHTVLEQEEVDAIAGYVKYLENPVTSLISLDTISQTIAFNCIQKNVAKAFIIPGFEDSESYTYSPYVKNKGNLGISCYNEFSSRKIYNKCMSSNDQIDPRLNHLSFENHDIMARKIMASIQLGKDLDLTSGFSKNIYQTAREAANINTKDKKYWDLQYDLETGQRIHVEKEVEKRKNSVQPADIVI